jgi:hypothetical protein
LKQEKQQLQVLEEELKQEKQKLEERQQELDSSNGDS